MKQSIRWQDELAKLKLKGTLADRSAKEMALARQN
jgi:hypothetical protein